jgi:hypothetical protein
VGIASPLVPLPAVSLAFALLLSLAASAHAAVSFTPQTTYPVGGLARSVAVGDFNADHDPDLVVANELSNDVSVLLGGPGGSFGAQTTYPAGTHPQDVAVGDFNRDGDRDLVVTNFDVNVVSVLLGGPGGTFGAPTGFPVDRPSGVAVGDLNRDQDQDLAVANYANYNSISVLLGKAGGAFGRAQTTYPVGSTYPTEVALGEFNQDGHLDVVTANVYSNTNSVLLGAPGGSFGAPVTYQTGKRPTDVAVGGFNGDGDPDLALTNNYSRNVSVRLGRPGGTFAKQAKYPVPAHPSSVAVRDFDRDHHPDLAFTSDLPTSSSPGVSVLLGGPDGTFRPEASFPGGGDWIAAGDFNQDGYPDVAASTYAGGTVSVLLNAISLDPSSIVWEPQPDSTESEFRTATLQNHSGGSLAVDEVALGGPDASSFGLPSAYDECTGTTVPDGQSCTVKARFRPDGVGPKSASLSFSHDGPGSPQSVALSGTGTPGPWLTPSVQGLKFGQVPVGTTTATKTVTLTNTGSAAMNISEIAVEGTNSGDFVGLSETCTSLASLGPDESCSVEIAFRPTAAGARRAVLTINDSAPRNPHHVGLYGMGT